MSAENIAGYKFGFWTVDFRLPWKGGQYAACTCDCGTRKSVHIGSMKRRLSSSCGCNTGAIISASKIRHGGCKRTGTTGEWRSWSAMKYRCYNPNHEQYNDYGGRGIKVCERWMKFDLFLEDMGPRPLGLTIDRIDTNGNYEPGNCIWSTRKTQCRNKRDNVKITAYGKTQCVTEWCEELNLKPYRVYDSVYRLGLSGEEALNR